MKSYIRTAHDGDGWEHRGVLEKYSHPAPPATSTVFEVDRGYFTLAMMVRPTYKNRPFVLGDV